ncbi:hypothetical protein REPUB_Repub06bG0158700 [Reevesia pubescens]
MKIFCEKAKEAKSRNKRKKPGFWGVRSTTGCTKKIKLCSESTPKDKTKALGFCEKVRDKTSCEEYLTLLRCLHDYGTGKITKVGMRIMMVDYFSNFMEDFVDVLEFYGSLTHPLSKSEGEKPNKNKNSKQVDKVTPSYEFLPNDLLGVHGNGVDTLGKEVLNSCCFSTGSYGPPQVRPRDPQEKMMNEKEDKLFERDMLMAWMHSTKDNATNLFNAINIGIIQNPTLEDVNKHFSSYNFRFIEKIYGKFGSLVVDQLRHSPETVLPVLLKRLEMMECPSLGTKKIRIKLARTMTVPDAPVKCFDFGCLEWIAV